MKIPALLVAAGALAALSAGCGEKCNTESPKVSALATGCTAVVNQPITYPVQVCPACNLSNVSCSPQVSGTQVLLDLTAEACSSASSCSASCQAGPAQCTFTPTTAVPYTVMVYDPTTGNTLNQTLTVLSSGTPSCTL